MTKTSDYNKLDESEKKFMKTIICAISPMVLSKPRTWLQQRQKNRIQHIKTGMVCWNA